MGTLAVVFFLGQDHGRTLCSFLTTLRYTTSLSGSPGEEQGRNQRGTKISLDSLYVQVVAIERYKWRARQGSNLRPLVPETTRMLARLSCSIIYVLLVPWFYLLFGSSCCRNVVGNDPTGAGGAYLTGVYRGV